MVAFQSKIYKFNDLRETKVDFVIDIKGNRKKKSV